MREVDPADLVAIAYRFAMVQHSWVLVEAGMVAVWTAGVFMSIDAGTKAEAFTGLSRQAQARVWERYQTNPRFAASVNAALANGGLAAALDEISQPITADEAIARMRERALRAYRNLS